MSDDGALDSTAREYFESIQMRTEDRALVLSGMERVMRSMGFAPVPPESLPDYVDSLQEEVEDESRRFFIGPAIDGWVSIFPSSDLPEQLATAQRLSEETHVPALMLSLHNGDVFYYRAFQDGRLIDQYDSYPSYFGEPREPEELEAVRGHPDRLGMLLPAEVQPADVEAILTQTLSEDEQADPDGLILWGDEQLNEFTRLLRIHNAMHSYIDAKREGLGGFVERPEEFIEVAYAAPLQGNRAPTALGRPA